MTTTINAKKLMLAALAADKNTQRTPLLAVAAIVSVICDALEQAGVLSHPKARKSQGIRRLTKEFIDVAPKT